jgi:hypothetical protein
MRTGIMSADPVSPRIKELGFGSYERPFIKTDLFFASTAFVDLHAPCRTIIASDWFAPALSLSGTLTVDLGGCELAQAATRSSSMKTTILTIWTWCPPPAL